MKNMNDESGYLLLVKQQNAYYIGYVNVDVGKTLEKYIVKSTKLYDAVKLPNQTSIDLMDAEKIKSLYENLKSESSSLEDVIVKNLNDKNTQSAGRIFFLKKVKT
jgi:hypothetical protein